METLELSVKGMTCEGCQAAVQRALSAVAGVSSAAVDLKGARATVAYDAGKASRGDLEKAVVEAGFEVG